MVTSAHGEEAEEARQRVLRAVPAGGTTVAALVEALGLPEDSVRTTLWQLARAGLVEGTAGSVLLTTSGRSHLVELGFSTGAVDPGAEQHATPAPPVIDLADLGDAVGAVWSVGAARREAEQRAAEAARDALLATDADRDRAVQRLSAAFADGRLTAAEHDERTTRALAARTHGHLDDVLQGLGDPQPVAHHPVRKVLFWLMTVVTSPFLLLGGLMLAAGSDLGDRVFGIVLLVLFLPGLLAVRRWAWPRSS